VHAVGYYAGSSDYWLHESLCWSGSFENGCFQNTTANGVRCYMCLPRVMVAVPAHLLRWLECPLTPACRVSAGACDWDRPPSQPRPHLQQHRVLNQALYRRRGMQTCKTLQACTPHADTPYFRKPSKSSTTTARANLTSRCFSTFPTKLCT